MLLGLTYQLMRFITDLVLVRTRSDAQLRAEVLALRHQLRVLERKVGKPAWQPADRILLAGLSRLLAKPGLPSLLPKPETLGTPSPPSPPGQGGVACLRCWRTAGVDQLFRLGVGARERAWRWARNISACMAHLFPWFDKDADLQQPDDLVGASRKRSGSGCGI